MKQIMLIVILLGLLYTTEAGLCNARISLSNNNGGTLTFGALQSVVCTRFPRVARLLPIGNDGNPGACTKSGLSVSLQSSTVPQDNDNSQLTGIDVGTTLKLGRNGCGLKIGCRAMLNTTNGCQYAMATKRQWIVRPAKRQEFCDASMNATGDGSSLAQYIYSRVWSVKAGLQCCTNGNNCNLGALNENECTENTDYSNFVQTVYNKWDYFKYKVTRFLLCNDVIRNYTETCRQNRQFRQDGGCRRRVLCNKGLRKILTNFGNHVCNNATNPRYGAYLATLLEDELGDICPGIDLQCNGNGTLTARNRIKRFRIKLRTLYTADEIRNAKRAILIAMIAKKLNVVEDDVMLEESSIQTESTLSSSNRRRLGSSTTVEFSINSDPDTVLSSDCKFDDSNVQDCSSCQSESESTINNDGSQSVDSGDECELQLSDSSSYIVSFIFGLIITIITVLVV